MDPKEILKFCADNGFLLDQEVLNLFSEASNIDSVKLILERIKVHTQQRIITKKIFNENKEKVNRFFSDLPEEDKKKLENLKIKLGLSIEISKEVREEIPPIKQTNLLEQGGNLKILSTNHIKNKKPEVDDFVKYFRNRFLETRKILQEHPELNNTVSINKISGNKQGISVIGVISDKKITKNKNIIFDVEDMTGNTRVLVNYNKSELYKSAEDIPLDSVMGFRCSGSREILFVNNIVFPDSTLFERKKSPVEEYALFLGDLHFGSKKFLEENFLKFIDYVNGKISRTPAEKIKYIFIVGDLVTGVGNYPNQENDLKIKDLEEQFLGISELLAKIRRDIKIIITSGNHDGIRLMEPQPMLDEKYAWSLYNMKNVFLTENPSYVNIGSLKNFSGFDVLLYHGFSFPYYADNVPRFMQEKVMNAPEKIMAYLLKNRHLAPTHASVQYFPSESDLHFIKKTPDIFFAGHTHKSAVSYYNNILTISSSSWESKTPYQEKFGNEPDHCKVPMFNLKTRNVRILDFEDEEK